LEIGSGDIENKQNINLYPMWRSRITYIITFMVLYSIIKPYNSFFVINRHIARQDFILNDLFSGGQNPGKILKFSNQTFSTSIVMTSHKQKVAHKFYKRKQNANINLYTSN
jgi:hypothetical protein